MPASDPNEQLVFDLRTLRLIIGALAFAFPCGVIALTGRITTSISASYHEAQSRDVFVGFLFIIGALLVSYKGHKVDLTVKERGTFWGAVKEYEEDWISTIGGAAALFTALFPTAKDGHAMDPKAYVHMSGAFILFAMVVYFCLIAFLRSVNEKLLRSAELKKNPDLRRNILQNKRRIRQLRSQKDVRGLRPRLARLFYGVFPDIFIFLSIVREVSRDYDRQVSFPNDGGTVPVADRPNKLTYLWLAYGKKIARGSVYLACGLLIAATLLVFLFLLWRRPDLVTGSRVTFVVETIALVFFGVAWMTASQLEYLKQAQKWWAARRQKAPAAAQPGAA